MHIEYHKWFSPHLGRDMELKTYGHYGKPMLVFPAQGGRFYEFEDFGMIDAVQTFIDAGRIKIFSLDSIDNESWANWSVHPAERAKRHQAYDQYMYREVAPFIQHHCNGSTQKFVACGVSMGGYHSANFFFRHPDIIDMLIALSGLYDLSHFVGDYLDDNVYYNSPLAYLPNLNDPWYLDLYRQSKIVFCCGQGAWEGEMRHDTLELQKVLQAQNIPAWIDLWGQDVNHDWPWWRKMLPYFLERTL